MSVGPPTQTSPRVLVLINHLDMGGAESVVYYLLRHWPAEWGYEIELCTLYEPGHFGRKLQGMGYTVHTLGLAAKYDPRAFVRLRRLLLRGNYQLLHVQLWPASLLASAVARTLPGLPVLYVEQNAWNRRRGRPWLRPVDRWMHRRFSWQTAVSGVAAEALVEWLPETARSLSVIPNAVDPEVFEPVPESRLEATREELSLDPDAPLLLFVGRLKPQKGLDTLLRAVADVPRAQLLVAGDGPLRPEMEALHEELGLAGRVSLLGSRPDVPLLLRLADALVLPSRWEGLPLVVLEALAAGTPVIATAVGGTPELLTDRRNGLLVPPDDVERLTEAINFIISHPDEARELSSRGREMVRGGYTVEVVAERYRELYDALCAGRSPANSRGSDE